MRIAIYSPYLDTFGGGERYMLTIAEVLKGKAAVDLLFDEHLSREAKQSHGLFSLGAEKLRKELAQRFDLDLSKVEVCKAPLGKGSSSIERFFFFQKYDLLIYLTDGSIFYPTARKNILHIQSPLVGEPGKSLWGKLKLKGWDLIIYNSQFTKENCKSYWPINSMVIYPPVDIDKVKPLKKKKNILSVGRFFGYLKDKKQEILIKAFKDLYKNELKDWSLHLVGSAGEGDKNYLNHLRNLGAGLPIKFYPNFNYSDLMKLYGQSMIYWHASGFEENDPTKMEHFGISTVEAMAAGCVPVVIGRGGQLEIVEDKKSGFLWHDLDQLKKFTLRLTLDNNLWQRLSKEAIERSKAFSKQKFTKKINEIL